jgi:hypothetical protein
LPPILGEEGLEEARLALGFSFIAAWGVGGVLSIRNSTSSSRDRGLGMAKQPSQEEHDVLAHNLGALFVNFGILEQALSVTVGALFGLNVLQENTFVRGMFARSKVQLLQSFGKKHWSKDVQEKLAPLFSDALALIDYRNDFAHGTILHDEDGKWGIISFRGANRFAGNAELIDLNKLGEKSDSLQAVSRAFYSLAESAAAQQRAAPQQSDGQHQPK